MSNNIINVDPYEREKFGKKLVDFEEMMKAAVLSVEKRLDEADGHLQDPGSKFYIAEGRNLVEELKALLDGGISDAGNGHAGKAREQIQLMEDFSGKMHR